MKTDFIISIFHSPKILYYPLTVGVPRPDNIDDDGWSVMMSKNIKKWGKGSSKLYQIKFSMLR